VHQLLDRYSRVIDLSLGDQIVQHLRRAILHLIDVDAGVEQEPLPADQARIDERQLFIAPRASVRCGSNRAQRRAASKSNAPPQKPSFNAGSTLPRDCLNVRAKLSSSAMVASANSIRSVSVSIPSVACLLDQRGTDPSADPAALSAQKTRSFRRLHDRLEPRLAEGKLPGLRISPNGLCPPGAVLAQVSRLLLAPRALWACSLCPRHGDHLVFDRMQLR